MTVALITGARGFIGRHLTKCLRDQGYEVSGIGHGAWPDAVEHGICTWVNGEIDHASLDAIASVHGPLQFIFHLAGGSSVGASFAFPMEDFRRTVETTARLLDWVRDRSPDSRVVNVSSAAVYGSGHGGPIAEGTPVRPSSPYGAHKAMSEALCESYASSFSIRAINVRLFSVYGPGLRKQLVWDLCSRLERATVPIELDGSGNEQRDWIYVKDAVSVLSLAAETASVECPVINGGTGIGRTVQWLAARLTDAFGAQQVRFSGHRRLGDPTSLVANAERARALGFEPQDSIESGLDRTIAWFKQRRD
jgi:UDP-glucose 4-epimerase